MVGRSSSVGPSTRMASGVGASPRVVAWVSPRAAMASGVGVSSGVVARVYRPVGRFADWLEV